MAAPLLSSSYSRNQRCTRQAALSVWEFPASRRLAVVIAPAGETEAGSSAWAEELLGLQGGDLQAKVTEGQGSGPSTRPPVGAAAAGKGHERPRTF